MSATAFRDRTGRKRITLSVTPLIDVLFLLIIFFAITGTFKRAGELELELPDAATSTPTSAEHDADQLEVIVTESGEVLIDGEVVEDDAVAARLRSAIDADAARGVVLKAETAVPHGDVVRLLDLIRDAGFPGVSIGTYVSSTIETKSESPGAASPAK